MIVSLENISLSFDNKTFILSDVSAKIDEGGRVGLIGPNGAGKTTLLGVLCGEIEADSGAVSRANSKSIGILRQDGGLCGDGSIQSEMERVFAHLFETENNMRRMEREIAATPPDDPRYTALEGRYHALQVAFEAGEGYQIGVKIATVLNGMGFGEVDRATPVSVLSGGERTRLAICKLLLERPDLLILDEPTNHLDFKTLLWLEDYLAGYRGALLIVSHDRYFLDRLTAIIWELDQSELTAYTGNYTAYLRQKEEREETQRKIYQADLREIAEMKDFVARNMARASTTARAKSRQKALEKLESTLEKPKPAPKPPIIRFQKSRDPVSDLLLIEDLSLSVGEGESAKQLVTGLNLEVKRGEKLALIGDNGVGKTSLLKALIGKLPHGGRIEWGRNCDICYFNQGEDGFDERKTALDELWDDYPREYEQTVRAVLGRVGLSRENAFKPICVLSGGERARLKFAKLMLSRGNVLILDEPTNHLDLGSKESIDKALAEYDGSLLVVSHDRYLLNKFPDKILEMYPDGLRIYIGKYDQYLAQKQAESLTEPPPEKRPEKKTEPGTGGYRTKKQRSEEVAHKQKIQALETKITALEAEISALEQELSDPETAADYLLVQEKCETLDIRRQELSACLEEWSGLESV
ncbi:MAG: ABC-F family ATP-binding cassette domain-containing protein [Oscillospiraceae bacterium]|nr:ABC-F family ATP-binding cassette domain-containing protein [Oscillospiraceae bacterium]